MDDELWDIVTIRCSNMQQDVVSFKCESYFGRSYFEVRIYNCDIKNQEGEGYGTCNGAPSTTQVAYL